MGYNTKNYTEQGGEKTVIGGALEIKEGASVTGLSPFLLEPATETTLGGVRAAANQADSTATEVTGLVTDFNSLLFKLKAAGLMQDNSQN